MGQRFYKDIEQDGGTSDDHSFCFGSIVRHFGDIKTVLDVGKAKPRLDDKVQYVSYQSWFVSLKEEATGRLQGGLCVLTVLRGTFRMLRVGQRSYNDIEHHGGTRWN